MGNLKVINLFAGPGAGKSWTRAGLFYLMKINGFKVEETTEYAKELTWEESSFRISDQLHVFAEQNRRLERLKGKVEWVISDSPIILGLNYLVPGSLPAEFEQLVWKMWYQYDNYNFFLQRSKPYDPVGRRQTVEEAKKLDIEIEGLLLEENIDFFKVNSRPDSIHIIFDKIRALSKLKPKE